MRHPTREVPPVTFLSPASGGRNTRYCSSGDMEEWSGMRQSLRKPCSQLLVIEFQIKVLYTVEWQ